jgi:hypothetical protein
MFGKPQWFREKTVGWGLTPVTWQGWAYVAGWVAMIVVPAVLVVASTGVLYALVWVAAAAGLLLWDVYQILQAKRSPKKPAPAADVLYIGDEEDNSRLATKRYDMRLR